MRQFLPPCQLSLYLGAPLALPLILNVFDPLLHLFSVPDLKIFDRGFNSLLLKVKIVVVGIGPLGLITLPSIKLD